MRVIRFIVLLIIVIGALNWGLWGFFQYDFIADISKSNSNALARTLYSIIGLAGVWAISFFFCPHFYGKCRHCPTDKSDDNEQHKQ